MIVIKFRADIRIGCLKSGFNSRDESALLSGEPSFNTSRRACSFTFDAYVSKAVRTYPAHADRQTPVVHKIHFLLTGGSVSFARRVFLFVRLEMKLT